MTFTIFDGILLAIVLLFAIVGAVRGFARRILLLISWALSIFIPIVFGDKLAEAIFKAKVTPTHKLWVGIALGVVVFLITYIIIGVLSRSFKNKALNPFDAIMGALLGAAKGMLFYFAILLMLKLLLEKNILPNGGFRNFLLTQFPADKPSTAFNGKFDLSWWLYQHNFLQWTYEGILKLWKSNTSKVVFDTFIF